MIPSRIAVHGVDSENWADQSGTGPVHGANKSKDLSESIINVHVQCVIVQRNTVPSVPKHTASAVNVDAVSDKSACG